MRPKPPGKPVHQVKDEGSIMERRTYVPARPVRMESGQTCTITWLSESDS